MSQTVSPCDNKVPLMSASLAGGQSLIKFRDTVKQSIPSKVLAINKAEYCLEYSTPVALFIGMKNISPPSHHVPAPVSLDLFSSLITG